MTSTPALRIGTRGSPLALAQTEEVRAGLVAAHPELARPDAVEVVVIKTTGDKVLDRPLADIGGKGLFTKEIDEAMLAERIDLAVHSMKDLPTWLPEGIALVSMLEREDPRDALISSKAGSLAELPAGAVVGTSSLRRKAQVLSRRPDLKVVEFRGNVQTRLRKLEKGLADATLLALAGLKRLRLTDAVAAVIETDDILPAVAQGAIGLTCRAGDSRSREFAASLDHAETTIRVAAERAMLEVLDGSCRTPIAALAEAEEGGGLRLRASLLTADGAKRWDAERTGPASEAAAMGADAGAELRGRAGADFPAG